MPKQVAPEFIDLHNNRNAALACWKGESSQSTIQMYTLPSTTTLKRYTLRTMSV
jgi:hypothetical protein